MRGQLADLEDRALPHLGERGGRAVARYYDAFLFTYAFSVTGLLAISVPCGGRGCPQKRPRRIVADRAYDSDPLRWRLWQRGMLLLSPHRASRRKPSLNDGRHLRRYRKRWKIERTFAWLGHFRRLVVRYDRHLSLYRAFFHLACALITLRFL